VSGPVTAGDVPPAAGDPEPHAGAIEIHPSRIAEVGLFTVRRALPQRSRRTVGPWCFVDHMGPAAVTEERGLDVGPHPHIGLQTVTWLLEGEALHRDSLGSEQVLRPGQLNLMTAGRGVSHSEEATGTYQGPLHGVQLWIAQPERTRDGDPAFEHHADLPQVEVDGSVLTVLVGELGGEASPARCDTEHVGAALDVLPGPTTIPLRTDFEHAVVVFDGQLEIDRHPLVAGELGYLGVGRDELDLTAGSSTRALLVGGLPFPEPILMWWNYVARDRSEISAAHRDWSAGAERFGRVASDLPRIETGPPPWAS
jgi:redox-sensitive bicupin YhaK (pirin superfamily)